MSLPVWVVMVVVVSMAAGYGIARVEQWKKQIDDEQSSISFVVSKK